MEFCGDENICSASIQQNTSITIEKKTPKIEGKLVNRPLPICFFLFRVCGTEAVRIFQTNFTVCWVGNRLYLRHRTRCN